MVGAAGFKTHHNRHHTSPLTRTHPPPPSQHTCHMTPPGHSMGGGTAALMTMMVREKVPELASARCYAFACPAVMTVEMAGACSGAVTTLVHGADIVPTFSTGSVDALREEVGWVGSHGCGHMGVVTWVWSHGCGHMGVVTWVSTVGEHCAQTDRLLFDWHTRSSTHTPTRSPPLKHTTTNNNNRSCDHPGFQTFSATHASASTLLSPPPWPTQPVQAVPRWWRAALVPAGGRRRTSWCPLLSPSGRATLQVKGQPHSTCGEVGVGVVQARRMPVRSSRC